jgi:hypothetical protein
MMFLFFSLGGIFEMHRIEETSYGYRLTFEGFLQRDEAGELLAKMKSTVRPKNGGFAVLLDMRHSRAFPAEAQDLIQSALAFCQNAGLERNAVVLNSAIATLQARRLAKQTGIAPWIRYIDASAEPEWEKAAVGWLADAVDPRVH